jgi:hypothetical protein
MLPQLNSESPTRPGLSKGSPLESRARFVEGFPWWLRPFLPADVVAITVIRTVYLSPLLAVWSTERREAIFRHELVHVEQGLRLGTVGFAARYLGEYLLHRWRGLDGRRAYEAISFEVEARLAEAENRMDQVQFPPEFSVRKIG